MNEIKPRLKRNSAPQKGSGGGRVEWTNTWICLGQSEIGDPLFIQPQVPSDCYIVLGLQKKKHTQKKQKTKQSMISIRGQKCARPNHFTPRTESLLIAQLSAAQEETNTQVRGGQPSSKKAMIQPLTYQLVNHSHLGSSGRKENPARCWPLQDWAAHPWSKCSYLKFKSDTWDSFSFLS